MSDSVEKDNLISVQIGFIFLKATSSVMCGPDQARFTCLMFKHSVMKVRVEYLLF